MAVTLWENNWSYSTRNCIKGRLGYFRILGPYTWAFLTPLIWRINGEESILLSNLLGPLYMGPVKQILCPPAKSLTIQQFCGEQLFSARCFLPFFNLPQTIIWRAEIYLILAGEQPIGGDSPRGVSPHV